MRASFIVSLRISVCHWKLFSFKLLIHSFVRNNICNEYIHPFTSPKQAFFILHLFCSCNIYSQYCTHNVFVHKFTICTLVVFQITQYIIATIVYFIFCIGFSFYNTVLLQYSPIHLQLLTSIMFPNTLIAPVLFALISFFDCIFFIFTF